MKINRNLILVLENNLRILSPHIIISVLFLIAVSIITILFMTEGSSVEFMSERVIPLTGILLYTPLFSAEFADNLHEVIISKLTKYKNVIYMRYVCASGISCAITLVYILINISRIAIVWITLMNTFCISLFLGNIGLIFARVSKKTVLGYMTSFGVYMICMFSEATYGQSLIFPPIGGVNGNLIIIFIIAVILCMVSLCKIKNQANKN